MTTYTTTWKMTQSEVNAITKARQWNSWALQVDGSNNPITWIQQTPWQEIDISLVEDYGAFVSTEEYFIDGAVLKSISRYPVDLGTAYVWNGSDMVVDKDSTCDRSSVKIINNSGQAMTFGMTKFDPKTKMQQPICCDIVLQGQPVTYTPIPTMYVKVGRNHLASSVIADIGSWTKFEITDLDSTFRFDEATSSWSL